MQNLKIIVRPLVITMGILLVPFLGNMLIDGWNWPWRAFVFFGVILLGAFIAYELAGEKNRRGILRGFIVGEVVAGGVLATLRYFHPEEDSAGVAILLFLLSGLFFATLGYWTVRNKANRGNRISKK